MADTLALSPNVPRAAVNTGARLWVSSFLVAGRMVRKFARTPQLIAFTAIQSALFLLMFRFAFGGAIRTGGSLSYINFLVPGFIATTVLWAGMGAAVGVAEDIEHGFIDRLRSLPIPRAAVLIGRSLADTALLVWGLAIAAVFGFAVGFRLHGSVSGALAAFGLCHAGRGQAVQRSPAGDPDGRRGAPPHHGTARPGAAPAQHRPLRRAVADLGGGDLRGVRAPCRPALRTALKPICQQPNRGTYPSRR